MGLLLHLASLGVRGAGLIAEGTTGINSASALSDALVSLLRRQLADNSEKLTQALNRSAARAWRAVEISLAGRSWWDRCKLALATADDRAIRRQVQSYLEAHPLDGVDGHGPDFRAQCLAQLQAARRDGSLDGGHLDPEALAQRVGDLSRFGDAAARADAEFRELEAITDALRRQGYEALATLLRLRPSDGPPLLVGAMRYFFRREVETDRDLFRGLVHSRLEGLADSQSTGFADLAAALDASSSRLETLLADVQAVVTRTHEDVLDIKAELARQGQQMAELGQAVLKALSHQHLERRELHGGDSLSIRDESERRLVRDLVRRYRSLPQEQRHAMPALLNAVGKLQVLSGDFEGAEKDFRDLTTLISPGPARAEAAYNAYRAALERRAWGEALGFLREAVAGDPGRFAPFPAEKFEPEKILGAGGFGVAILCRNRHSSGRVVIKSLRRDGLDRDLGEVFREAQTLEDLEHPAIIRIRDCDYADPGRTRPYFVMDYFAGQTLDEYVSQYGVLATEEFLPLARTIASGLEKAHTRGILHRDVKPGNILVRRVESGWEAKIIDFGLALRAASTTSTMNASLDRTLTGTSIAGTLEFAAPEQMGKLRGVAVGPYSDVFGFAKTCCFALFGTAQPTFQHWKSIPNNLADLLGRCLDEKPQSRPQGFTEVLRELRPVFTPRPAAAAKVMDVIPVDEPGVVEVVRPRALPTPRPGPEKPSPSRSAASRSAEPLPRTRRERQLQEQPPRSRRGSGALIFLVFGIFALFMAAGAGFLFLRGQRPFSAFSPPPPVVQTPTRPQYDIGKPRTLKGPWPPDISEAKPIKEDEFPKILEEFKKHPDLAQLRSLASRLAKTDPPPRTPKKEDGKVKNAKRNGKDKTPPEPDRELIATISAGLQPLIDEPDLDNRWYGATAMQKWGTSSNVPQLIVVLHAGWYGGDTVRMAAAKALGAIKDSRGVGPVVHRIEDTWDVRQRWDDLSAAINSFGPMAEPVLLPYIQDNHKTMTEGKSVCKLLALVGTEKSLPYLEAIKDNFFCGEEARKAITTIRRRMN